MQFVSNSIVFETPVRQASSGRTIQVRVERGDDGMFDVFQILSSMKIWIRSSANELSAINHALEVAY
jgi:hypothetical protein